MLRIIVGTVVVLLITAVVIWLIGVACHRAGLRKGRQAALQESAPRPIELPTFTNRSTPSSSYNKENT